MKELNRLKKYLNTNYRFRYNEITSKVEFKNTEANNYELINDRSFNSIFLDLVHAGISIELHNLKVFINSHEVQSYNPIKDYFKMLPKIKGEKHINQLMDTIDTHDNEFFAWAFKKWLIGWVACMIDDNVCNQQCVILSGTQGIGKSTWVEKLMPRDLIPYYFAGNIKLANKDTLALLSSKSLINLDELASMTYSNVTELKELVTKSSISFRKPYGYHTENYTRRASFIGSVNGTEFLYDLTGNRRFLSFEVNSFVDFGNHSIHMDKVMSEVFNLYIENTKFWFDAEDQLRVEKNNEKFLVMSVEEMKILEEFSPLPLSRADGEKIRKHFYLKSIKNKNNKKVYDMMNPSIKLTHDAYFHVMKKNATQGELVKFGKILNKLGFKRKRTNKCTAYEFYNREPDLRKLL